MFPNTYLPLNIFEPRYLKMIDEALATESRLIGMIQPMVVKDKLDASFHKVGCAGKIIKFEEVEDNRYLITLKGLSRFNLIKEKTNDDKYEVFIDIIFDIKSDPLHVTRKRKLQFALHKKPILKVINEGK